MRHLPIALAIIGLVATPAAFAAEKLEFEDAHTSVNFGVRHMMLTKVRGKFTEFEGSVLYDDKDITKSQLTGTIKTGSITTHNERRDKHLRSPDFFDAVQYPTISFKSKKIEKQGDSYVALGDLTMRGVTKEVRIPFTITGKIVDKKTGKVRVGVEATFKLNRQDYGVSWNKTMDTGGVVVGDEVEIELVGEAVSPK